MKLKKDFELSLWEDFMDTINGKQFINERKICTIASQTFDHPSAASNVVFKSKTDGTHELTFDIVYRYWDNYEQDFIENPFRKYLFNEAKVKLKYKGKWFDFVIKNCSENSKEKKFSYSCKDLYIDELGRNGYSVEFATSLGGNVGDVTELAAATLKDSDWQVSEASVVPVQKVEEAVYAFTLPDKMVIQYQEINEDGVKGAKGEVRNTKNADGSYKNKTIFILYSCANNEDCKDVDYQFYYNENEKYEVNDDGFFIHTNVKFPTKIGKIEEKENEEDPEIITWQEKNRIQFSTDTHTFNPGYRGYRYVRSQKTEWLPKIGKMVNIYKIKDDDDVEKEYYGYQKTTYLSPDVAKNVLINSTVGAFDGTIGWRAITNDGIDCQIELGGEYGYDVNTSEVILGGDVHLRAYYYNDKREKIYPTNVYFYNLAFEHNLKNIGAITSGEKWVYRTMHEDSLEIGSTKDGEIYFERNGLMPNTDVLVPNDIYDYYLFTVKDSLSYEQLLNNPLYFELITDGTFYGGEFFRYYTYKKEENGEEKEYLITPETEITSKNLIKNEYYYFTSEQYEACRNESDLQIALMEDTAPAESTFVYNDPEFKKVVGLETKESNYFNIIQTLNEKFDCWADFQIEHNEDGSIAVDANGKRKKWVVFKNYIGKENWSGFKYGLNLDGIQRTIDSEEITTKTIVRPNSNEFAKNGSCNIARAKGNPSGSQAIINFDYFIRQGVLKENEVRGDLYVESTEEQPTNTLGYYAKLKRFNDGLQILSNELTSIENAIQKANATIQASNVNEEDFVEKINAVNEKLAANIIGLENKSGTPIYPVGNEVIFFRKTIKADWSSVDKPVFEWAYKTQLSFYQLQDEKSSLPLYVIYNPSNQVIYNLNNGRELVDNYNKFIKEKYYATENKRELEAKKAELIAQRDGEYSYVDVDGNTNYITNSNAIMPQVRELDKQFYSKYNRFIREGTWTSEDYTDDELYYYDACSVSYTSAFPKTTYSISVVDIKNAIIPDGLGYDYSNYDFNCGDLTTIEDTEFFGWAIDNGKKRPYREIVVISETEDHLDNPDGDKITVQNYKTQFDDLFQRMAAATQTLELKEGVYDRAGNAINLNGTINQVLLQNTLYNNELVLQNAGAQNLEWSDRGIIAQDLSNPMLVTRVVGGGILISEDGGKKWSVGISGKGINASNIKTGQLDVGKIKILNGNDVSFSWDSIGISGFDKKIDGSYDFSKYTRMDRFGFYCVDGEVDYAPETTDNIWDNNNVLYCLTKRGLRLGVGNSSIRMEKNINTGAWEMKLGTTTIDADGKIQISADNLDMQLTADQIEFTNMGNGQSVKMGSNGYALIVKVGTDTKFSVDYLGAMLAKSGTIAGWTIDNQGLSKYIKDNENKIIGSIGLWSTTAHQNIAIHAGYGNNGLADAPFRVYHDGRLYATSANISGTITAKSGKIGVSNDGSGGWTIAPYSLTSGNLGEQGSVHLYTKFKDANGNDIGNKTIAGGESNGWRLVIDNYFGVTYKGELYATKANITGTINAQSGTFYEGCVFGSTSNNQWTISSKGFTLNNTDGTLIEMGGIGLVKRYVDNSSINAAWNRIIETAEGNFLISDDVRSTKVEEGKTVPKRVNWGGLVVTANGLIFGNANKTNYGYIAFENASTTTQGYGMRITPPFGIGYFGGSWFYDSGTAITSDINKKNSITEFTTEYEILFDELIPRLYKYNDGTSNRIHTGFVAQEVNTSLENANIPTSDFAGLVINKYTDEEGISQEDWYLRYEEFISLNTWQIQKLKTRVTELENEIQSLKQKLS